MTAPLKRFSLKGKTFKNKIYGANSSSSSYQFYNLIFPYSSGIDYTLPLLEEIDFSNITVDSSMTSFGYIGSGVSWYYMSKKAIKFNGQNMKLNNIVSAIFSDLDNYGEFNISGTSAPKATSLKFQGGTTGNDSENSKYNVNSPYNKNSYNRLKTIKLKGLDMPNLTSLSFPYLYNLSNIEIDLTTTNITSFKDCFR